LWFFWAPEVLNLRVCSELLAWCSSTAITTRPSQLSSRPEALGQHNLAMASGGGMMSGVVNPETLYTKQNCIGLPSRFALSQNNAY